MSPNESAYILLAIKYYSKLLDACSWVTVHILKMSPSRFSTTRCALVSIPVEYYDCKKNAWMCRYKDYRSDLRRKPSWSTIS
jgi:hypothetical protein